jgi:hypothetical protein
VTPPARGGSARSAWRLAALLTLMTCGDRTRLMCCLLEIRANRYKPNLLSCHPPEAHACHNLVSSLPDLPDPESITDESSAAGALSSALVAAATANRTLSVASGADEEQERGPRHARTAVPSAEWELWLREFHRLLVKIAVKHAEIISWSVSVGTDFSLTINFATVKHHPST